MKQVCMYIKYTFCYQLSKVRIFLVNAVIAEVKGVTFLPRDAL